MSAARLVGQVRRDDVAMPDRLARIGNPSSNDRQRRDRLLTIAGIYADRRDRIYGWSGWSVRTRSLAGAHFHGCGERLKYPLASLVRDILVPLQPDEARFLAGHRATDERAHGITDRLFG